MKSARLYLMLSLAFSFTSMFAQNKKFQFGQDFATTKQLEKAETTAEKMSYFVGMYSNKTYLETRETKSASMFEQEVELVCIPIWKELWTENEAWYFQAFYYAGKYNAPMVQYVNHCVFAENENKMTQYLVNPAYSVDHPGEWLLENAYATLKKEQLVEYNCETIFKFTPEKKWIGNNTEDCAAPEVGSGAKMFVENELSADLWKTKTQFKTSKGVVIYANTDFMEYSRLPQKEIQKRIKKYSK